MIPATRAARRDVLQIDVTADVPAPTLELAVPLAGFTLPELDTACRSYAARAGRPCLAFWAREAAVSALAERDLLNAQLREDLEAEFERVFGGADFFAEDVVLLDGSRPEPEPKPEPAEPDRELESEPEPADPEPAHPEPEPEATPLPPDVVLVRPTSRLLTGAPVFSANRRRSQHVQHRPFHAY